MIHTEINTNPTFYNTPVQRTSQGEIDRTKQTYLFKFINDSDKREQYAYPKIIKDFGTTIDNYRYTKTDFTVSGDMFDGGLKFEKAGYYYYEIYEVVFPYGMDVYYAPPDQIQPTDTTNVMTEVFAPMNENNEYREGLAEDFQWAYMFRATVTMCVEEGKLLVQEEGGSEEVQYTQHTETESNYIYTK